MMTTPICDFVKKYAESGAIRLHMPGHKGESFIGCESRDITEINGAGSLYEAGGIIKESEDNASALFGSRTFYSTEGSSHCIRAMLYLFKLWAGQDAVIFAGRNAHKSFLSAIALLDIDVEWIYPNGGSYLSCNMDLSVLDRLLSKSTRSSAVYITSPDYLGNMADIKAISEICKKHGAVLLVENAHGAYLKFLPESRHPIDLGADICCDSAHKTLPVLTGGAYLHVADRISIFAERAKDALSLFGSTSPSYLILQSLDAANKYIASGYAKMLDDCVCRIADAVYNIKKLGFDVIGSEPLKITVMPKRFGYSGGELAEILQKRNIFVDFADNDYVVMMFTPENAEHAEILSAVLKSITKRAAVTDTAPIIHAPERAVSPREALFTDSEIIDAKESFGRIFAGFNIACPPAVPIVVCGERIDESTIKCFEYYGIEKCPVIKEENL